MNIFDTMRDAAFDVVGNTMGYTCTWAPFDGGETQTATVLYKDQTEQKTVNGMEFNPLRFTMEWRKPFLEGLKDSVDINTVETITIDGKGTFYVRRVETLFDGNNFKAYLEKQ